MHVFSAAFELIPKNVCGFGVLTTLDIIILLTFFRILVTLGVNNKPIGLIN